MPRKNSRSKSKDKSKDKPKNKPKRTLSRTAIKEDDEKPSDNIPNLTLQTIDVDYIPIIYKVPDVEDIFKTKLAPEFQDSIPYPKFSYGFHHFIHQTKDKMEEITKEFDRKKRVYEIISKFEKYVDDYDKDLDKLSKDYFDTGKKPDILSRAFFKLWELLFMFDLLPTDKSNVVTAHLAEGPGSFIQATMFYRDLYATKKNATKEDKYYAITLHNEGGSEVPDIHRNFIKYYEGEKPQRFIMHKTSPKAIAQRDPNKDNGDLTDLKTIDLFSKSFSKEGAHFITADGGFPWKNENLQEQEAFSLILGEILTAINIQANGGNFVCKIYESFTDITIKLICALKSLYDQVYLVKPLTSRKSNSEKYIVCIGFKTAGADKKIQVLRSLLKNINDNSDKHIVDFFPDYVISNECINMFIQENTNIANRQFQSINEIVDFVHKQNYRGDEYQNRRNMQIEATKFWAYYFYPPISDFKKAKNEMEEYVKNILDMNKKNIQKLSAKT